MKRGFLNKPKKSSSAATKVDSPPRMINSSLSGTLKDNVVLPDSEPPPSDIEPESDTEVASGPQPGDEPALDPHRPPQWLIDNRTDGRTRFIFRTWPRDPNGETPMVMSPGKTTSNGNIYWGATLYDFYFFRRVPSIPNYIVTTTGSRLAATMRRLGELEAAAPEIIWADREEEPRQLVLPAAVVADINNREAKVAGVIFPYPGNFRSVRDSKNARDGEIPLQELDDEYCDISSITPENYPGPWPIVPFSSSPLPKLETLIPYTLLPKKLVVHDPWNLLSMPDELDADTADKDWTQMPDIVRIYKLKELTDAGEAKSNHQHEIFRGRVNDDDFTFFLNFEADRDRPCPPPLAIKVPPYPHKKTTPAAHLYISPASKAGVGNHSAVYHAEWELPRSLLVPDVFCRECVAEEIQEMRRSGKLDRIINDAMTDKAWGHFTETIEVLPETVVDVSPLSQTGNRDESIKPELRIVQPRTIERTRTYKGPTVDIYTKVQWQTPGRGDNCAHVRRANPGPRPPTATVRVCAKLSIQGDRHLAHEAQVYQALPAHLSEHWSGYNLVQPSREPVPVGAVVPQFYGYYVPSPVAEAEGYLSPIMLLENCGKPLDPHMLSADQKTECWSLLYRLHDADWVHESIGARNIMVQPGPLTLTQGWMRGSGNRNSLSFRVIDFGRSLYCGPKPEEEGAKDEHLGLRVPDGRADEWIRMERVAVDKLLEQGYMLN
ncbi:hypothetical protein B0H15DRAFT_948800 [Mycena belliarum]|uniref:Protein kinase domain-containing protein n=1 Tax=Mycena belliarum TaxID=1033014 RepID=A0AAD6U4F9_9AGAR|nr:hypothetical protein B0H15DRAFT_948800 [Mycena belliae]